MSNDIAHAISSELSPKDEKTDDRQEDTVDESQILNSVVKAAFTELKIRIGVGFCFSCYASTALTRK